MPCARTRVPRTHWRGGVQGVDKYVRAIVFLAGSVRTGRISSLKGAGAEKRGAKPAESNPLSGKVRQLEAKVAGLEKELATAHTILDVQGNAPRPPRPSWCERNSEARVD